MTGATRTSAPSVFRVRAFLVLFTAETVSIIGSQLARFAISVLVFDRTGSAAAAALTYATSVLPVAVGGLVLGRLGDRYSRRALMITVDVLRALLFVAMAASALPVWTLIGLLVVASFLDPAFVAAEVSLLADVLDATQFRAATGLRSISGQFVQVLGFAVGGVVVAVIGSRGALLVDAATFVVSATLVRLLVREPPRRGPGHADARFRGLWRDLSTRWRLAFTLLIALFVLPEALAVPYAHELGASTVEAGLLLAAIPLGSLMGLMVVLRVTPGRRRSAARVMAVACGLPLLASAVAANWGVAFACWTLSGVFGAYQVEAIGSLVERLPATTRTQQLGAVTFWLVGAQGVAFGVASLLATRVSAGTAVTVMAGLGVLAAVGVVSRDRTEKGEAAPAASGTP